MAAIAADTFIMDGLCPVRLAKRHGIAERKIDWRCRLALRRGKLQMPRPLAKRTLPFIYTSEKRADG